MNPTVAVIFGGKSAEHSISLKSATNIFNALDTSRFAPILLGVDKKGNWRYNADYSLHKINLPEHDYFNSSDFVYLSNKNNRVEIKNQETNETLHSIDIAFPIIHGTFGEDGTLQGILKSLNLPFVGPDVLGSAIGMDKDVAKRLLRDAGIPIADFFTLYKYRQDEFSFEEITTKFGLPIFVKPANAGSSVGVKKVKNLEEYKIGLKEAFKYDNKILIEEAIVGIEVECAVLGNEEVRASVIGEIIPTDFYSFEEKYVSNDAAKMAIPANIAPDVAENLRTTAIKIFKTLECEGMSRVDFFLKKDNSFVLNEINTLPGFTAISMYPKLWEHTGLPYKDLLTELINLAIKRAERNKAIEVV